MRQATGARMLRAFSLSAIAFVLGSGASFGQEADIKAAIEAYHSALEALSPSKMEPLWVHDGSALLVNPADKSVSVGWDAVNTNWQKTFDALSELKLAQTDGPHIQVKGDVAWSTGIVKVEAKLKPGTSVSGQTLETDVFEKRDGAWLLASHSASNVPK